VKTTLLDVNALKKSDLYEEVLPC